MIDYNEYIRTHPRWQKVREERLKFDNYKCVVCGKNVRDVAYQTHHLCYQRLGHERLRDVITMCPGCHKEFHANWTKIEFWRGRESGHWDIYNLEHTAKLCSMYWRRDRLICRDINAINLCSNDVCIQVIDEYFRISNLDKHPIIDPHDISLFVRNKRYELFFAAEADGKSVEEFLDSYYGPKVRGKNPIRQEAGRKNGPFDHKPESFHRHYKENPNLNLLMRTVEELERNREV